MDECVCHSRANSTEKLTKFSEKSWNTFRTCAKQWRDIGHTRFSLIALQSESIWTGNREYDSFRYHRGCYQDFTNKTNISKARKSHDTTSEEETTDAPPATKRQRRSFSQPSQASATRILPRECIFHLVSTSKLCGKSGHKFIRDRKTGSRKQEKLVQCLTLDAERRLKSAALQSNDEKLLFQIRDKDLIAVEVCYHRNCYSSYVRTHGNVDRTNQQSAENQETDAEAFEDLALYVEGTVIVKGEVLKISKLMEQYMGFVHAKGGSNAQFRTEKLKKKLLARFGPKITFWRPKKRNRCELIYSDFLPKGALLEKNVDSSSMSEGSDCTGMNTTNPGQSIQVQETRDLYHAAQILRRSMMDIGDGLQWPPTSNQLNSSDVDKIIPLQLHNFLALLISPDCEELMFEDKEKVRLPKDMMVRVESISQDILFAHYRGRVATPKHVALGVSIRHLSKNVQILGMMNRFGHSVSLSYLQELDTAIANEVVKKNSVLPENIMPSQYTTLVFDNIDLMEETLSGKGTTHNTNGIVIQRNAVREIEAHTTPEVKRTRERSFASPIQPLPQYFQTKREGPGEFQLDSSLLTEDKSPGSGALSLDFAWLLLRSYSLNDATMQELHEVSTATTTDYSLDMPSTSQEMSVTGPAATRQTAQQTVPGWSAFNSMQTEDVPKISRIGYLPVIPASPTEMSTVYSLLVKSLEICSKLDQEEVVVVLDEAIYCKAQQVLWKEKEKFSKIVLRLGAFHTTCVMLAVIGKRFRDAGLEDILIESGILASGSMNGVMNGKHYNRATRIFKIVYEALHRLRWQSFLETQDMVAHAEIKDKVVGQLKLIGSDAKKLQRYLTNEDFQKLQDMYTEFCLGHQSEMFSFWSSFLDMMQDVLNFIRATRTGNFKLHLAAIRSMLPWMCAYDRHNYMRYCSVYWLEMMVLPNTYPSVSQQLHSGEFVVQRSRNNKFGQVACDMAIEQTFNKDTKSPGGIIGFSLKSGAVAKWILSSPERAATVAKCRELAGLNDSSVWHHKDQSRLQRDEEDVLRVMDTVEGFANPFTEDCDQLMHLTAGYVPPPEVHSDLLSAKAIGEERFLKFVNDRLLTNNTDFYSTLKLSKLKTFNSIKKVVKVSPTVNVQEDRNLFSSILVINNNLQRKVDLQDMFTYTLGTYPYSLATPGGCLVKTCKSKLLQLLEKDHAPMEVKRVAEQNPAWIFDAMAVLQQLVNCDASTFGEFAEKVLSMLLTVTRSSRCKRVDFVPDRYLPLSIKTAERQSRASSGDMRVKVMSAAQKKPMQWKKYLANGQNKSELIQFLFDEWRKPHFARKLQGIKLVVAHGEKCHSLTSDGTQISSVEIPELFCNHEEADTRMFLHAEHAAKDHPAVVIRSPDTDVAVLGVTHYQSIQSCLYFDTGTKNKRRIIDIGSISTSLGIDKARGLLGLHAFTGCDSVSSFYGKGKAKSLSSFLNDDGAVSAMNQLGSHAVVTESLLIECETFVCKLYGSETTTSVNQLRHENFTRTQVKSSRLPPNKDSLSLHIKRANYQAYIWRNALKAFPELPTPIGQGWKMDGTGIVIAWMTLPPAPKAIMELLSCRCKKNCSTNVCQCKKNSLNCTEACTCKTCTNRGDAASAGYNDDANDYGDSDEEEILE
ncbi:uncharacterized protein [Apostichopus japonicus]|uniref:uncharacterized protein n=1 Tax=Stichopus japonicus TaxID=307972 RepID=UPI003AB2DA19